MGAAGLLTVTTRDDTQWLAALRGSEAEQAAALAELRTFLLRAALYALRRARGHLGLLAPAEIDALAEDCAQEAVMAVVQSLDRFRGESRFTTWAYAFAVNAALMAARHERWKRVPLEGVLADGGVDWAAWRASAAEREGQAQRAETLAAVHEAIEVCLSERQRQALKAVVFDGVPLDELARHWGSNRNALYKLLHDARRKLKAHLEVRELQSAQRMTGRPR
jgi:RNA polymerase sigma-70 factor, ECF subfamily